jgi:hypothetical protein
MFVGEAASRAIESFNDGTVIPSNQKSQYDEVLFFGEPPQQVRLGGRAHLSVITVAYPDEAEVRRVFEPADYTNVIEIRIKDSTLFVYRSVTLVWTENRLAVFDLVRRKRVGDYLVSPDALADSGVRKP